MTKKEIQKRVLQYGKPLGLSKFSWDEKTRTFSSSENYLVLDFKGVDNITFNTASSCTFDTGPSCTFNTDNNCTFDTGNGCVFNTGSACMFNTEWECTFKTGSSCTFNTEWECTFKTGSRCTFDIIAKGYFVNNNTNNTVVVRNYDNYNLYELNKLPKDFLQLEVDKVIEKPIKEYELADNSIMIKLSSEKIVDGVSVYKTQYISDYFKDNNKKVFIAKDNEYTAHGTDIKDAIKNVIFKKQYTLGVEVNAKRVVESGIVTMEDYRLLTGSCEEGTKRHLDEHNIAYDTVMSIEDTIKFIESTGAYRKEIFIENIKKVGWRGRV